MKDTQGFIDGTRRINKPIRNTGVLMIILGIVAMLMPQYTGMAISIMLGFLLLLVGSFRLVFSLFSAAWGNLFLRAGISLLTMVAGGYLLFDPQGGNQILTILLIAYLLIDGLSTFLFALSFPPALGGMWIMSGALISILLGVLLWMQWPLSGTISIGILLGVKLLIDGIQLLAIGRQSQRYV